MDKKKKIIMLCAPARSGKDTIGKCMSEILVDIELFAFANKLKQDCEDYIQKAFGVSVWDDNQKHIFRDYLIEYGKRRREETENKYLTDHFIKNIDNTKNYIITDHRFVSEYKDLQVLSNEYDIIVFYIERSFNIGDVKFVSTPTIGVEVEEYGKIIEHYAYTLDIPWFEGDNVELDIKNFLERL